MQPLVRVLGPVDVVGPAGDLALGGPKERCLLAALAVRPGEAVAEDRLIDALWDGEPPRTAVKTLQNYVLRLRHRLGGAAIRTRPPGYALDGLTTDATTFRELVARARRELERGAAAAAIDAFDEALALWRGTAFSEFADRDFARAEAAGLDELRAATAEERVDAILAAGGPAAVAECERLVADEPLRERRWTQLMLALYRDGRQAEALDAYRRLREALAGQLGVDPGRAAQQLHAAVLAQAPELQRTEHRPVIPARRRAERPCFGRDAELAALLGHLADAAAGAGRVTFVSGEPGIGKSRLLAELGSRAAAQGARVLSGRCLEGAGARPFHPFAEAVETFLAGAPAPSSLTQLVPDEHVPQDAALRPDELRLRLLDGVVRFLVACSAEAPVVLVVDDLHWADDGTVAMLRHVARSTRGHRLLVVGTYRGGEVSDDHPLADALGALRSEAECAVVRLTGLRTDALRALVSATAGAPAADELVDAVAAESRGNPFFTQEIVTHLREDGALRAGADGTVRARMPLESIPEGVRQVIARRRRRLTATTNRLLDVAAAIDGPFLFEPVRAAAGLSADDGLAALDEALHAQLVVPDSAVDRYDFTHALVRHTVRQEMNPSRRLRLHRDLADALAAARRAGARIDAAEVAIQFDRSAELPGATAGMGFAIEAADRAGAAGAHAERATFLQVAANLLPGGDEQRAALLGELATAQAWALRFDDAVATVRAAGSGAATIAEVAEVLATAGSTTHAWQLAAAGLAVAGDVDPVDRATLTLLDLDRREAADPAHPGMPLDLPGRRAALRIVHGSGRLARRGDLTRYALAAVHGRRDRIPSDAAADPTVAAFLLGDCTSAVPAFAQRADDAEARGQLAWAVYCRGGQARCLVALGRLDEARAALDRSRRLVARLPGLALGWQLLHHEGAEDAWTAAVDEGWEQRIDAFERWMRPGPERHWGIAGITAIGARCRARRGAADAALPLLAGPVRALSAAPAWAPNFARTAHEVAETLWLLDRRDHLLVVEEALRDRALPADFRFPMTDSRLALARLCALDGRTAEAGHWFDAARDVLEAQGARPLRAVVDHDQALMFARAGDRRAAAPYAEAAATAFADLGMTGWTRRLERTVG